ncbi:hypothetical protein [Scytonema hofmannii]|nr:hypothetical protein [Scytonema hofmannii]
MKQLKQLPEKKHQQAEIEKIKRRIVKLQQEIQVLEQLRQMLQENYSK